MNFIKTTARLAVAGALLATANRATILEGTDQPVTVNSVPQGAKCTLTRDGVELAVIDPTPQTITVDRRNDDILILCEKDGFADARFVLESEVEGMTGGNVLFGGIIGIGVDAATGALNRYDSTVVVPLTEAPADEAEDESGETVPAGDLRPFDPNEAGT